MILTKLAGFVTFVTKWGVFFQHQNRGCFYVKIKRTDCVRNCQDFFTTPPTSKPSEARHLISLGGLGPISGNDNGNDTPLSRARTSN